MLSLSLREQNSATMTAAREMRISRIRNGDPARAFLFQLETQERTMPYLFWAVLPFALMDTWWGVCEQRRDTE